MNIEIRLLQPQDERSSFSSDNEELDVYLKKYAGQNQFKHYIGSTYIALVEKQIIGYLSVSSGEISCDSLSKEHTKKLPNYPLPILRLTRLAVDKKFHNKGIGTALLKFTLDLAIQQSKTYGCFGAVVDSKPESVAFYEKFGFVRFRLESGELDTRPFPTSMFLGIKVIMKAVN